MRIGEKAGQAGEWLLKLSFLFILIEVIWMLLPFAGFLYGSVLHLQVLSENPSTAWLTHFVFPVLTLGPLGPILMAVGLLVFLVGASQIYWAKIHKQNRPVTGGLYRFVRHPQYISLTLFGIGVLLTWGRAVSFLAFSFMMFLYYHLARNEEGRCVRLFGEEYEHYREKTSFIFPGDRWLRPLGERLGSLPLPRVAWVLLGFFFTVALALGAMRSIQHVKTVRLKVPFLEETVCLLDAGNEGRAVTGRGTDEGGTGARLVAGTITGVPYASDGRIVAIRGPYRNAAVPGFAERVVRRMRTSTTLHDHLAFLNEPDGDVAFVFSLPFEKPEQAGTPGMHRDEATDRGPPEDPAGPDRVRLAILRCSLPQGGPPQEALADKTRRTIRKACLAPVNLAGPEGTEIVEGALTMPGPGFPGEERWDFFLSQLAAMRTETAQDQAATTSSQEAAEGQLVLVQAPILRTRLDPPFAREILDRLLESPLFVNQLRKSGVGEDTAAVAFPRPGPNWYREHHGTPQVSLFVMLVRKTHPDTPTEAILQAGDRQLLGAFTAEMDFAVARPGDSISGIKAIGPRRDLEERWSFFVSGL